MISLVMILVSMSLQAVLIIGVIFAVRKLFLLMHVSKKYVMLLWMIPFFFLVFPWKAAVPGGFWNSVAAESAAGLRGAGAEDAQTPLPDAELKSDSRQ